MRRAGLAVVFFTALLLLPAHAGADDPVTITSPTAKENVGTLDFTVTGATADMRYVTADGSVNTADGNDYVQVTAPKEIPADGIIHVEIKNDSLDEVDEQFVVRIIAGDGTTTVVTGTGTIQDDDNPPSVTIANADPVNEGNSGTTPAKFAVTLSGPSGRDVTVNYRTADVPGGATNGEDYQGTAGSSIVIPKGSTTGTIQVNVIGDTKTESDETFLVILTGGSDTVTVPPPGQATGTIKDDDPKPTISIAATSALENVSDKFLKFKVTLSAPSPVQVTVLASTHDDTAVAPTDYQVKSGEQITFAPGQVEKIFQVQINDDSLDEENETLLAILSSPSAGATIADGKGTALGTIIDDDNTSLLSVSDATADEPTTGTATLTFTVSLSPASARTVRVGYATADGTATAGSDYTATSGTLTFAPGQTSQTVTVSVIGDSVNEDNETVMLNLVNESRALVADRQGHGTIIDKNAPPSLSINDVVTQEGDGAFFTITLAGTTLRTVTVVVATSDGTATAGADYLPRRTTVTFAPGETTKSFSTSVLDDALPEPTETFNVGLQDATNATITKSRGVATIQASDQQQVTTQQNTTNSTTTNTTTTTKKPTVLLPRMVLAPRVVLATKGGIAKFQMTCAKASPITCAGSVSLESVTKPILSFGRKPFSVKKGKRADVPIKLSAKAFKLLKQRKTLRARAIVMVKTGKTSLKVVPGVITLKAPKTGGTGVSVATP